jgi:cell division protein FtsZ
MGKRSGKKGNEYSDAVFVGVGGCGINTVSRLSEQGITGSKSILVNRMGDNHPASVKGASGITIDMPLSTRMPLPDDEINSFKSQLSEELKGAGKAYIFAGLGGATGTSLAPIAAQTAKELGVEPTIIITMPFEIERTRCEIAKNALSAFQNAPSRLIVRDNNDLVKEWPNLPINEAFKKFDEKLVGRLSK